MGAVECIFGEVDKIGEVDHAGVVDDDVDAAESRAGRFDDLRRHCGRNLSQVCHETLGAGAEARDLFLQLVALQIDQQHLGAVGQKSLGTRQAESQVRKVCWVRHVPKHDSRFT